MLMTARPVRRDDVEINPVADGYVVYDPDRDRVHYLNTTAAVVLEFCTGELTGGEIAAAVQEAYHLEHPVEEEVAQCLAQLSDEGLITVAAAR